MILGVFSMIQEMEISKLTLLDDNPRQVRKGAIDRLAKSLSSPRGKELFNKRPCLVNDRDGKLIVYAGNQRLRAAKSLGWEKVPCIIDKISLKEEREETIKDNLVIGEWDDDILANSFDLNELEDWGMDLKDLGIDPLREEETDEVPEPPKEARAERGKIYQLGKHRVMCGDSTNASDVALLMDGKSAVLCLTDPPYSVNYDRSREERGGKKEVHDAYHEAELNPTDILGFLGLYPCNLLIMSYSVNRHIFVLCEMLQKFKFEVRKELVWVKDTFSFWMSAKYQQRHEPFWICTRNGASFSGSVPSNESTVFEIKRPKAHDLHPTMKPMELWERFVRYHSEKDEIVCDPFLGSGTTLIAAEQHGRVCFGMEFSPQYVDVIIERYCNYTKADKEEIYGSAA